MKNGQIIELPQRQRTLNGDRIGGLNARIIDIDGNLVEIEILATGRRCFIIATEKALAEMHPFKQILKIFYHTAGLWVTAVLAILKQSGTISWSWTWVTSPIWGPPLLVLLLFLIGKYFIKKQ